MRTDQSLRSFTVHHDVFNVCSAKQVCLQQLPLRNIERSIILSSKMKISLLLALSMASSASAFAPAAFTRTVVVSSEHNTALCAAKSKEEDLELTRQVIAKFVEDVEGGDAAVDMPAPPAPEPAPPAPAPPAPAPVSAVAAAPAAEPEEAPKPKRKAAKKKSATKKTATKKKKKKEESEE